MRITIFGASGKVGRILVKIALKHGHNVTVFVHSEAPFSHHPYLTKYHGDVHNPQDVVKALRGSDGVLSALGSWGTSTKNILSAGMRSVVPAMKYHGIQRIVSLTGADVRMSGDEVGRLHRLSYTGISLLAGRILRDSEDHIRILRASNLDWVVIRSPIMVETGNPAKYHLSSIRPAPWGTIHRTSVALSMITELERPKHTRTAPYISRT